MNALHDNTDLDKCLCCGQPVLKRGNPITPERAERALAIFTGLGFSRDDLLGKHRAQLDYQSPGFAEWLEARPEEADREAVSDAVERLRNAVDPKTDTLFRTRLIPRKNEIL
jgi:hypothetical protein